MVRTNYYEIVQQTIYNTDYYLLINHDSNKNENTDCKTVIQRKPYHPRQQSAQYDSKNFFSKGLKRSIAEVFATDANPCEVVL